MAFWNDQVTEMDRKMMGSDEGDPAFQSEWELLAVWISLEAVKPWIMQGELAPQIILRTDNKATIQAAMEMRSRSPLMTQLTAEIAIQIELMQLDKIHAEHVRPWSSQQDC